MKKYISIFVFVIGICSWAHGQIVEGVDNIQGVNAGTSIVRSVDAENTLIYTDDGYSKHFVLYDHANGQVYSIPVHSDAIIKDFEVYNGWAYFCGQMFYNYALVGQFEITDVFFNGGPVYYEPMALFCETIGNGMPVMVTDAWKMTLYDNGNMVYIFAVGMGLHNYTEPTPYSASVLFSAGLDLNTLDWDFCVNYSKDKTFYYTDIDCTDNYVAVTAVGDTGMGHVCINVKGDPCFANEPEWMLTYYWGDSVEDDHIRITGMSGDRFTVAYQPRGESRVVFVQVPLPLPSMFQATSTLPSQNWPYGAVPWELIELRYSEAADKVLLVGEMAMPSNDQFNSWIVDYDWSPAVGAWDMTQYGYPNSVDSHRGSSRFMATAGMGDLIFAVEDILTSPVPVCMEWHDVDYTDHVYLYKDWYVNPDEQRCPLHTILIDYPEVEIVNREELCR